jgi:hypothetical protein
MFSAHRESAVRRHDLCVGARRLCQGVTVSATRGVDSVRKLPPTV